MTPLSIVIITFNEEKNIERCLQSVQAVADEIVVVDSFSQDKTKEICQKYTVQFYEHPFEGHIQQKNYAASLARHDFVLSLDADEVLSEELQASILREKQGFSRQGYYMHRLNNYCGQWIKHGGWYPDKKLRLWNRHRGTWGGINPHDQWSFFDSTNTAGLLAGDLLHYSYHQSEELVKQSYYFATIAAHALNQKGIKSTLFSGVLHGVAKFIKMYILQYGFLDGKAGFTIAKTLSKATFYKYKTLYQLTKEPRE